ncbi:MAG: SGNH/GDSL hydrolase family protein [Hoeflea sp.]|nr:SGNH/GDSL hydrolase family protein [Hoeflea sp.]
MAKTPAPQTPTVTLSELFVLCYADPDRASAYFQAEPGEKPFSIRYTIKPELIHAASPAEIAQVNTQLAQGKVFWPITLAAANALGQANRQADYRKIVAADKNQPRWVAEGDSWFHFPLTEPDDIVEIMLKKRRAVYTIAGAGDEIRQMLNPAAYRSALRDTGAKVLIFSGGGNDMLGGDPDMLAKLLPAFKPGMKPEDALTSKYTAQVQTAIGHYRSLFADMKSRFPDVWLFCHGYDYALPRKGGRYIYPAMTQKGFPDAGFMWSVVKLMVDRFNQVLAAETAKAGARIRYVDLRNTVAKPNATYTEALALWHDEIHPTTASFSKLTAKLDKQIAAAITAGV